MYIHCTSLTTKVQDNLTSAREQVYTAQVTERSFRPQTIRTTARQSARQTARQTERDGAATRRLQIVQKMLDSEQQMRKGYEQSLKKEQTARRRCAWSSYTTFICNTTLCSLESELQQMRSETARGVLQGMTRDQRAQARTEMKLKAYQDIVGNLVEVNTLSKFFFVETLLLITIVHHASRP